MDEKIKLCLVSFEMFIKGVKFNTKVGLFFIKTRMLPNRH